MADTIALRLKLYDSATSVFKNINNQIGQTIKQKRNLSRQLRAVGSDITSVGKTLLPLAGAITAVGGLGVKSFIDFDYTITSAGAKANATKEEVDKLRQSAIKLGADFPISASDAAKGMENLAAAGYSANEIVGAMPAIVTSAVASGEDLALVSSTVSNALNIWNLRQGDVAKNASHVADVVQMAANKSSLALGDFSIAMQYAGAPAAALHVSIEELSTAMAIMKNNGIEASSIGTSLRATFTRLADPPKEAATILAQLGVTVKDSKGQFIGLANVISQLRGKMQGLSDTEKVAYAQAIAGTNGYSGLLSLINTSPDSYKAMADAIENANGSAQKQADIMKNTLKGALLDLLSKLESLGISTVSIFAPSIKTATNAVANLVAFLNSLSPATKEMVSKLAMGVVGFTAMTFVVGKLFTVGAGLVTTFANIQAVLAGTRSSNALLQISIKGVTKSYNALKESAVLTSVISQTKALFMTLKTGRIKSVLPGIARGILLIARAGMTLALSPIGLIVTSLAFAAYLLYKNWNLVAPYISSAITNIKQSMVSAWNSIQPALNNLWVALRPIKNILSQLWILIRGSVNGAFKGFLLILKSIVSFLGTIMLTQLKVIFSIFASVVTNVINVITIQIKMLINIFAGIITFLTGVFMGDWQTAWRGIVQVFGSIFSGVKDICHSILGGVKDSINAIVDGINGIHVSIPEWVPVVGGKEFGPLNIPKLYQGTSNWMGGPAMIHDKGAEIVDLPSGTRVFPHDKSLKMAYNDGKNSNNFGGIIVNVYNATVKNEADINTLAHKIASQLVYELKKHSINRKVGAI